MALLTGVTIGCGPAIHDADASTAAATQAHELPTVRRGFLIGKLGLPDSPEPDAGIDKAIEIYGRPERNKYRAAVHYLLTRNFGREAVNG